MSKIKVQPIQHIPSFKEYSLPRENLYLAISKLGLEIPMGMFDSWYYHSDMEGWGKILWDLVFDSRLYKQDIFDCEDYAIKAFIVCRERYGLNGLAAVVGDTPYGRHGFNMFFHGDGFMLFEPNAGFDFSMEGAFEIGGHGYKPELVLL